MTASLDRTAEQRQVLDAADALLARHFPPERLRTAAPEPLEQIAAFGLFAAEEGGLDLVDEALVHVRLGRHLVAPGALAAALAGRLGAAALPCAALRSGEGLLLFGAPAARAVAWGPGTLDLLDLGGLTPDPVAGIEAGLAVHRVPGAPTLATASPGLHRVADLLVSAQLLGIAEATRDLAVAYAGQRRQFGRPIGSFQAVKHRCADMAVAAEVVSAQLDLAAIALRDGWDEAPFQVAALRHLAAGAALANARACIQVHGGFGFSAESGVHHYLKRAHLLARLGGEAILDLAAPLAPHERS